MKQRQKTFLFLVICLVLGILAELSFFHGVIGISYPIFIAAFYAVLYYRLGFKVSHRRIGLLLMVMIWVLSASFLFYDNEFFYALNLIVIPVLVFVHIVLITTPNHVDWISLIFFKRIFFKISQTFSYVKRWLKIIFKRTLFRQVSKETSQTIKRIVKGLLIGGPLLFVVTVLLISADEKFADMMLEIPAFILKLNFLEYFFRVVAALLLSLLFFGAFQTLRKRYVLPLGRPTVQTEKVTWDSVIAGTILVLLNTIYVLFVVIQFTYFFGDALHADYTYAEYARRGFFELVLVTVINWTLLLICLKLVKAGKKAYGYFLKAMYTLLIVVSGVMLASAFIRLSAYEAAYGFTLDRILAHVFMLFLMIIFAYTLVRVWLEGISIAHFYIIVGLLFYTGLNTVNLEEIIVEKNLERYEETGKIDIYYLDLLSYSGIDGLITLYEKDPNYPDLLVVLEQRKEMIEQLRLNTWQSFNFKKRQVVERLQELELR